MKLARTFLVILLLISGWEALAQESNDRSAGEKERVYTPTLGVGVGMLTYYGDISRDYKTNNPVVNRLALSITVTQPINRFLSAEFFYWRGTVAANERTVTRNRNFESLLNAGGISVTYNFDHLLQPDRILEPFIGVGVEYIDFNSKTDLVDEFGNTYHYWSDGTIRSLPENAPNSDAAIRIQRDYDYETDLRELNRDQLGLYNEYTIGVPVSAGANMRLGERWNFRLGATYHFTFNDFIDGVTENSSPEIRGDSDSDNLLYVGFNVNYNLSRDRKTKEEVDTGPMPFPDDFDTDGDGVIDWIDQCANTPDSVKVDELGCPLDGDKDEVANYRDQELNSASGAIVDTVGVTYTDQRLLDMYLAYMDTTGKYSPIEAEQYTISIAGSRTKRKRNVRKTLYAVKVGEFDDAIPSDLVNSILNYPDVQTLNHQEKIVVALGQYNSIAEAMDRRADLSKSGVSSTGIIAIYPDGRIRSIDGKIAKFNESDAIDNNSTMYRVQLGAFTRKANEKVFEGLDNVIAVSSDDGFTRYYSGSFSSYNDAARHKIEAIQAGFKNAYVVALKGGRKVPLREVGATLDENRTVPEKLSPEERTKLKFRVQLGSYRKQVPTNVLEKYMELDLVDQMPGSDGITRYVAGSFATYEEANAYKNRLLDQGFSGVFVVGEYRGKLLPAQEALKLIR